MKTKKMVIILTIVMMSWALTSCAYISPNYDWSVMMDSYYKEDVNSNSGQLAVVWDDRIYYSSNELEDEGVYSMTLEGDDVRFEFLSTRITRMKAVEDGMYYIGYYTLSRKNGKIFGLYKYYNKSTKSQLLVGDGERNSVEDFLILQDGTIVYRIIEDLASSVRPDSYTYMLFDYDKDCIGHRNLEGIGSTNVYKIEIYEDFIFTSRDLEHSPLSSWSKAIGDADDALYNFKTDDALMYDFWGVKNCDLKAIHIDESNVYLAYFNELIILDRNTLDDKKVIRFKNTSKYSRIDYALESEENLYLIFTMDDKRTRLFVFDTDTFDYNELMFFGEDKILINVQNDGVLYAEDKKIVFQNVNFDGMGDVEYELSFKKNIIDNHIFEVAGNWLFIYDRGKAKETGVFELLYKVNLETKEIIKIK